MSLIRKGIMVSAGQGVCLGISVLVGIIFSRALGPDGMGHYELLRSAAIIAITFFCAGLSNANIYFLNNRRIPAVDIASNGLKTAVVMGGLAGVALILAILNFPGYFGAIAYPVVAILAVGVAANVGMWILRGVIVARLAVARMILIDVSIPVTLLIAGGVMALSGALNPQAAMVILAIAYCASFGLTIYFVRHEIDLFRRFDWGLFRGVFAYGLKIAAANLFTVLSTNVTLMLLRYLRPGEFTDVGLYARAVAVCGLVLLVPWSVGPLLYAKWAGVAGRDRTVQAEMAIRISAMFGVFAALLLALFGKYVLWLLYGAEFIPAQVALIVLAPSLVLMAASTVFGNLLSGDGRAATTAVIMAGTLVILTIVTWFTVPLWGIRGAAFGSLCGNGFLAVTSMIVCCRLYQLKPWNCVVPRVDDLKYIRRALKGNGETAGPETEQRSPSP